MKPTIIAVDFSAIFYQQYEIHANYELGVAEQYRRTTNSAVEKLGVIKTLDMGVTNPHMVICCDDRKNWRKDVDKSYKGNRDKRDEGFYDAIERCKDRLRKDGYPLLQFEGFEADDVIASLACESQADGYSVIIASPDKDLLQLVRDKTEIDGDICVRQLRTHKMFLDDDVTVKLYDEAMVKEEFGVPPHRFADYLALVGDKADNIIGIDGVGAKAATAILEHFGSLSGLLLAVEKRDEDKSMPPWLNVPSLTRCATALTKYFKPDESGKAYQQITNLSRNRILTGLKAECDIDMVDVLKERKVEKLTKEDDKMGYDTREERQMDIGREIDAEFSMPTMPAMDIINKISNKPTETQKQTTTAIATVAPRSVAMQQFDANLAPTGMEAVYWYAKRANDSRVYLKKFGNEDVCLMAIMRGKDYGLSMTAALETLHVIEGKICLPAAFMASLIRRDPDCEYFDVVESTDKFCKMETKRRSGDRVFGVTFTIEEAQAANLVKPGSNWTKWAVDMLQWRATSRLGKRVWSGVLNGCNSLEEMEGV